MKNCNQKMIIIAVLTVLLSGCSGKITGDLYYDLNNNGIQDVDEPGAGYVMVKITHDGKIAAQGYSLPDGHFSANMKKRGIYCVDVDTSDVNTSEAMFGGNVLTINKAVVLTTDDEMTTETTPETTTTSEKEDDDEKCVDKDGDGKCDDKQYECVDKDKDGVCDDYESKQKQEEEDKYKSGEWTNDGFCKTVKRNLYVSIPISIDFSSSIAKLPPRIEQVCYVGDICEIFIPFPDGCELEPVTLPAGLVFVDTTIELSKTEAGIKTQMKASSLPQTSVSKWDKDSIQVRVNSDELAEKTASVEIEPTAECAGQSYKLHKIPIKLIEDVGVKLYQNLDTVSTQSDDIEISVTIENTGKIDIEDGVLRQREVDQNSGVMPLTVNIGCSNLGQNGMECRIPLIEAGQSIVKRVLYRISEKDMTFVFESWFTAAALDESAEATEVMYEAN